MKLKELNKILNDAPNGSTHYELSDDGVTWWKINSEGSRRWGQDHLNNYKSEWQCVFCYDQLSDFHSLSDIRKIVEIMEVMITVEN